MEFAIAQVLGVVGGVANLTATYMKDKTKVLYCCMLASTIYVIHYILLKGYSGAVSCVLAATEAVVLYIYTKYNKKPSIMVLVLFIIAVLTLGILTVKEFIGVLPIMATLFYTYAIWYNNLKVTRVLLLIVFSLWIPYIIYAKAYAALAFQVFIAIGTLIAIIKIDILNKDKKEKD